MQKVKPADWRVSEVRLPIDDDSDHDIVVSHYGTEITDEQAAAFGELVVPSQEDEADAAPGKQAASITPSVSTPPVTTTTEV